MKTLFLFAGFLILSASAMADDCLRAKVISSTPLPNSINWFLRGSAETNVVGFATDKSNQILDLKTKKMTTVAGDIDPVLSPDGKILVTPLVQCNWPGRPVTIIDSLSPADTKQCESYYYNGQTIYKDAMSDKPIATTLTPADLRAKKIPYVSATMGFMKMPSSRKQPNILKLDGDLQGNYQSLGVLERNADETKYRILYLDQDGGFKIRDYKLAKNGVFSAVSLKREVCSELKPNASLPILSKDGKEVSVFNAQANHTQIYELPGAGGPCRLKADIGARAGKPDFSADSRRLIFHVNHGGHSTDANGEFDKATATDKLTIDIYDRAQKKLIPVQVANTDDAYYPIFLSGDRIAYVSAKSGNDGKLQFSVQEADLLSCNGAKPSGSKSSRTSQ